MRRTSCIHHLLSSYKYISAIPLSYKRQYIPFSVPHNAALNLIKSFTKILQILTLTALTCNKYVELGSMKKVVFSASKLLKIKSIEFR